jgi:ribosome-associated protein
MEAMERESMSRRLDGGDPVAQVPPSPAPERGIRVTRSVLLPFSEIELRVSRSSGPGGQHAQKSSTRVEAVFDVEASEALTDVQRRRVVAKAGPVLRAVAQDERSQLRNRELAVERVVEKLRAALAVPRRRVATQPGPRARERRLEQKRRRARTKALRRPPTAE